MKRLQQFLMIILWCMPFTVSAQSTTSEVKQSELHHADTITASVQTSPTKDGSFNKVVQPFNSRQQAAIDYQKALRALAASDMTQAETNLTAALKHEPLHIAARQLLASILMHRQELTAAQQVLEDGTKVLPQEAAFRLMLARVYCEQQQPARGIALLENLNAAASLRNRVDVMLAALYQRVGRYDEAIILYRHLLRRDPRKAIWWLGLAMSLEASHRPANALTAYRQARLAKPGRRVVEAFIAARIAALSKANRDAQQS